MKSVTKQAPCSEEERQERVAAIYLERVGNFIYHLCDTLALCEARKSKISCRLLYDAPLT